MFGSKTTNLALTLLLLAHFAQSFVLLTANIEDVKKLARKFVSEPLADQIADFIAKATGQGGAIPNVSQENEQNVDEVDDVSENELDQFSKAARQKPEQKRYKTKTTRAKIEYVEDKSELYNVQSEPLIQYNKMKDPGEFEVTERIKQPVKFKEPNRHKQPIEIEEPKGNKPDFEESDPMKQSVEYKEPKRNKPKYEVTEEARDEILELETTRQQKRWKKKENFDDTENPTTRRQRFKKKKAREPNLDDSELSFQLVNQNSNYPNQNPNYTNGNGPTDSPRDAPIDQQIDLGENFDNADKQTENSRPKDPERDYKPRDNVENYEESNTRFKSRSNRYDLVKGVDDAADGKKLKEVPRVNAFNIANDHAAGSYLMATSGSVVLPKVPYTEKRPGWWQRSKVLPKPQQIHEVVI